MNKLAIGLACATVFLSACNAPDDDAAEDRVEDAAEASAAAAGTAEAALGLTEAQLLEADLLGPDNVELGDVTRIERAADGTIDRLLIEVEDSNPDRYVHVPIAELSPVTRGDDIDLSTPLTKEHLAALPDVALPTS